MTRRRGLVSDEAGEVGETEGGSAAATFHRVSPAAARHCRQVCSARSTRPNLTRATCNINDKPYLLNEQKWNTYKLQQNTITETTTHKLSKEYLN